MSESIEGTGTEVVVAEPLSVELHAPSATLFRSDNPAEVVQRATEVADALAAIIERKSLFTMIGGRRHVQVEGWTLLGSLLGVFPVTVWTRALEDGWESRVEARTLNGQIVGAAEAECRRTERTWRTRDSYALRSMAQTRATSKALRLPLGFVMQLAGYEATPAEEMPEDGDEHGAPDNDRRIEHAREQVKAPRSWTQAREMIFGDNREQAREMFDLFVKAASFKLYGATESRDLTAEQRKQMLQRAGTAVLWLVENVADGPITTVIDKGTMQRAWATALQGEMLEIPGYDEVVLDFTPAPEEEPTEGEPEPDATPIDAEYA